MVISAETIRLELAGLERGWTWVVREISPTEFVVSFPTAQLLTHLSWSPTITLPIHNIRVSIRPAASDPDAPPPLAVVWVRIHGIPAELRSGVDFVALIAQAVGRFVEVDVSSLPGDGPVWIRVMTPDPAKLNITLPTFYFDGVGRTLVVELESEADRPRPPSPPAGRSPSPTRSSDDREGDSSEDDPSDDDAPPAVDAHPPPASSAPPSAAPPPSVSATTGGQVQAPSLGPLLDTCSTPLALPQSFGLPLSQYGSNLCEGLGSTDISGLVAAALGPRLSHQVEMEGSEDSTSVGMEVLAPDTPRSPGVVWYSRSPGTPAAPALEPVTVFPDTPVAGARGRPRRHRSSPPAPDTRRQSARLAMARTGGEAVEPTVTMMASRRREARDCGIGTSRPTPTHTLPPTSPPSGSQFSVLDSVPLDHLAQVAGDCDIIFRGERGPRLEQIAAIKAKEVYEGALAAARAQAKHERQGPPAPADPVQEAQGSGNGAPPRPDDAAIAAPASHPRTRRGRPPKSRCSTSSRAQSVPPKGTNPNTVSQ